MNLQYISDSEGKTTGVFIPISEWDKLKEKFQGIEDEQSGFESWQQKESLNRIAEYQNNSTQPLDFDIVMDEIEKSL